MRQASPHSCPNQVIHEATDCTCKVISASPGLPRATRLASYHLSFCSFCKALWKADASQFLLSSPLAALMGSSRVTETDKLFYKKRDPYFISCKAR